MNGTSFEPTNGSPKDPIPLWEKRVELLENEVKMLHSKLLAARRELALLRGSDPQLAFDELLAELERAEKLRLERERELAEAQARGEAEGESSSQGDEDSSCDSSSGKRRRKGHGPRPQLQLPRIEELYELSSEQCQCKICGGQLEPMGDQFEEFEEITVLEREYVKKVHKRRKYRCRCNSCIETAPGPLRLIPGGRYSLDFAVHVAVDKYLDHLPLERQSDRMERYGLEASSQTLWDQLNALASVVEATYQALGTKVLEEPVVHADESRWPLLSGPGKSNWTIWTRSTPEIAHYAIRSSKSTRAARRLFSGYKGIIVADGYAVYEKLVRAGPDLHLANCWAHVLRKFRKIQDNFPTSCQSILKLIGQLYKIERKVPGPFPGDDAAQRLRLELRKKESQPIVKEIRLWVDTEIGLPRSKLGKAVKYMLKRWQGLTLFVDNPQVPLDNNAAERSLRGPVVGRKNHYGSKSRRGTEVAAIFYTLLETAKLCGVEPAYYLKTVAKRALRQPGTVTFPQELF